MRKYNTDSINHMRFRPHGRVEWQSLEDNILVYTAYGPFNKELLDAMEILEKETFSELKKEWGYWAEIVVFKQSCMIVDDAFEDYKEFFKDCKDNDMAPLATAYVLESGIEGVSTCIKRFRDLSKFAGIPFNDFKSFDEALKWVKVCLKKHENNHN